MHTTESGADIAEGCADKHHDIILGEEKGPRKTRGAGRVRRDTTVDGTATLSRSSSRLLPQASFMCEAFIMRTGF